MLGSHYVSPFQIQMVQAPKSVETSLDAADTSVRATKIGL